MVGMALKTAIQVEGLAGEKHPPVRARGAQQQAHSSVTCPRQ